MYPLLARVLFPDTRTWISAGSLLREFVHTQPDSGAQFRMRQPYHVFRTWIWELLSAALAIGLMTAIIALLASNHAKQVPDWGVNLGFNALLALLSTFLRAMLVVIVSQVICQQKWEWLGRSRPLSDVQRFESGSRGSFGALLLIPTVRFVDVTTLTAAIILVASFLVGPFVQQASRTTVCKFPGQELNASIPFAHYVPRRGGYLPLVNIRMANSAPDTVLAILSAVTAPEGVENQVSASCSTGDCTFPNGDPMENEDPTIDDITTHSTAGMCNICVNATSLVIRGDSYSRSGLQTTNWTLPNGMKVDGSAGYSFAGIQADSNLTWMRDMLSPELKVKSRWAYANVTFLEGRANFSVATTCVLYPCLRTYTVSVNNNSLSERQIGSKVMQIGLNMTGPSIRNWPIKDAGNALSNANYDYATIKSPCRVDGVVYETHNMSLYSRGTKIGLFNFTDPDESDFSNATYTYENITAPEQCIYRQSALFVGSIAGVLHDDIFNGWCNSYRTTSCGKNRATNQTGDMGQLFSLGAEGVLKSLIRNDERNITRWFDSFADTMTNRFRSDFGAMDFGTTNRSVPGGSESEANRTLPLGQIQGIAWNTTTCVSMQWQWLLLPILLTVIATVLLLKTIFVNWRHRQTRPVWKDNILPFLFYGHKIESHEPQGLPGQIRENSADVGHTRPDTEGHLLETSEMATIAKRTVVTFQWPDDSQQDSSETGSAYPLQQEKNWLRQRQTRGVDANSLLGASDAESPGFSNSTDPRGGK